MELRIEQGSVWDFSPRKAGGATLTLEPSEALSLGSASRGFRVLSGVAWVSWRGQDIFLNPGDVIQFTRGGGSPVLSAARRMRVVIEFLR
jgi:hypothetical protein